MPPRPPRRPPAQPHWPWDSPAIEDDTTADAAPQKPTMERTASQTFTTTPFQGIEDSGLALDAMNEVSIHGNNIAAQSSDSSAVEGSFKPDKTHRHLPSFSSATLTSLRQGSLQSFMESLPLSSKAITEQQRMPLLHQDSGMLSPDTRPHTSKSSFLRRLSSVRRRRPTTVSPPGDTTMANSSAPVSTYADTPGAAARQAAAAANQDRQNQLRREQEHTHRFLNNLIPASPQPDDKVTDDESDVDMTPSPDMFYHPLSTVPNMSPPWNHLHGASASHEDSDSDRSSQSYANSMISTVSLASSATDLSKQSGYTPVQIAEATKELINILRDDEVLAPLYLHALADVNLGPQKLERNLREFFKNYARLLKNEAGDAREILASQLVLLKARYVARSITEKYNPKFVIIHGNKHPDRLEVSSDEDTEKPLLDHSEFGELALFRDFLIGSDSFTKLRAQIRSFVMPKSTHRGMVKTVVHQAEEDHPNAITSVEHVALDRDNTRLAVSYQKPLQFLKQAVDTVLITLGYKEPPLKPGFTRLRWRCKCGDTFFGDVVEYREGGINRLMERMQRSTGGNVVATSSSDNSPNQRYTFRPPTWMRSAVVTVSGAFGWRRNPPSILPQQRSSNTISTPNPTQIPLTPQESVHLMTCMRRGQYRRIVRQDPINDISTDKALFYFLGSQLAQRRSHVRNFFSLKSVHGLFFVKFRLKVCGSAEIRDHETCCSSIASGKCNCIPPASKVIGHDAEYRCEPAGPLDWGPPVVSQELMHMFTSPECIHEEDDFVFKQLPKKLKGELKGELGQAVDGWGLYYHQDRDYDKLISIALVICLMGSLLFAVLWSYFKWDVQGAFGVSSYMVTVSGVVVAWIVNRAEKLE